METTAIKEKIHERIQREKLFGRCIFENYTAYQKMKPHMKQKHLVRIDQ